MATKIPDYEKLTFEDAVRIIFFSFWREPRTLVGQIQELLMNQSAPYKSIAPMWYEAYKEHLSNPDQ